MHGVSRYRSATRVLILYEPSPTSKDAFCFGQSNDGDDGIEHIEVRFDEPLYVSSVEVYEVFKPGALTEIAIINADEYVDDNTLSCGGTSAIGQEYGECVMETPWVPVWTGEPQLGLPDLAVITAPPLCPTAFKADLVRLRFETAAVTLPSAFIVS